MAVKDLHEAAVTLRGAHQAIERLLDETEPMERERHQRLNILLTSQPGTPQEVTDRADEESGWRAFYDAVWDLRELLGAVDTTCGEETRRHLGLPAS